MNTPFDYDKVKKLANKLNRTLKLGFDKEDAEQEAMLAAYDALPKFQGGSHVDTFVTRCVINHFLNCKRDLLKQAETVDVDINELEEALMIEVDGPEEILQELEVFEKFEKFLEKVEEEIRFIITQRVGNERAFADIAKELKQPVGNVKVKLHRAIKRFKKDLGL